MKPDTGTVMSSNVRRISYPSGEPSESFMRKARNFMQNWEVSGGSMSFDGYKVRLKINSNTKPEDKSPFEFTQSDDLKVTMTPGNLNGSEITTSEITLATSTTTYLYLKLVLTAGPSGASVKYRYDISTSTIEDETSTQTDSGDSYAAAAGTAWHLLATAVTDSSEITSLTQQWTGHLVWAWSAVGHLWGPQT